LRAVYRQIRLRMSRAEVSSKSRLIGRKLLNDIEWDNYRAICAYEPISRLNEVGIAGVVRRLEDQGKSIFIMPTHNKPPLPDRQFDLILVPCLAFDKDNYRLGWGGGFYDKFLARQPKAMKIGLCFDNGLAAAGLPREPHDIRLDRIITER
jgi:5-formyltetrahydrofolate cyclo-ligase